ncbi:ecto-ADP-ribosyltransferase 5-like [Rhinophrynus dorsalis]
MAPAAFDDQYFGCREEMEAKMPSLLEAEKSLDPDFKGIWEKAASEWKNRTLRMSLPTLPEGFQEEHGIAILVYTNKNYPTPDLSFPSRFNRAVRTSAASVEDYHKRFHFKALHYYLTTALQLFKPRCNTVYRGIRDIHFQPPNGSDPLIRFGQFTSSSFSQKTAKEFGQDSFFHITTCYGVDIMLLSMDRGENEVLIPGGEIFRVSNYTTEGGQFVLKSTKHLCHHYNCAFLGGKTSSSN